jgi:bisphosphoglycerate-dependent phosphoglycerate mutase
VDPGAPVVAAQRRHYGDLQGKNKKETTEEAPTR